MKIAVVTGASSGMGKEFALQLSGYVKVDEIWVIARRTEALESLKAQIPVPVRPISLDLCKEESFAAYAKLLEEEKLAIVPGTAFGDCGEGFLRISYAYSIEQLKEALDRMESFIKRHRK